VFVYAHVQKVDSHTLIAPSATHDELDNEHLLPFRDPLVLEALQQDRTWRTYLRTRTARTRVRNDKMVTRARQITRRARVAHAASQAQSPPSLSPTATTAVFRDRGTPNSHAPTDSTTSTADAWREKRIEWQHHRDAVDALISRKPEVLRKCAYQLIERAHRAGGGGSH
jgi:hypothetical protein